MSRIGEPPVLILKFTHRVIAAQAGMTSRATDAKARRDLSDSLQAL
jgi:hypothetical protein